MSRIEDTMAAIQRVVTNSRKGKVYGAAAIQRVVTNSRKGKVYGNTSRYNPHQGPRECARRVRQMAARG